MLFVVLGGLLVFVWPRMVWFHIPAALWGAFIEFSGGICPLTPLEVRLRELGGVEGYTGSFVEQYLLPVLYPTGLTQDLQLLLGGGVITVNLIIYGLFFYHHRRQRRDHAQQR